VIETIKFIAIEGGDGSGKGTQAELLRKHYVETLGKHVLKISFPQYDKGSAYFVKKYLNGEYGTSADDVSPRLASLFYALDRFDAKPEIISHINDPNGIIIADRYVASNMAHQGTKYDNPIDRRSYYDWEMDTEFGICGIPRPDKNIVLLVPTSLAQQNVDKKDTRSYTDQKRDIHEADASHLDRAKANYEEICQLYPDKFSPINCVDDSLKMRRIEDIQQEIRAILGV
jgi:dTMP kinase